MNNYVDSAVNHYRALLEEQLARVDAMNNAAPAKDFTALPVVTIGVIDGDGIGPIISKQTSRVLEVLLKDELASGSIVMKHIEGLTIENRLAKGQAVPDDVLAAVKERDVLLKGPTETPKGGTMGSANVRLRQALDLYANVRPVSVPEKGIDWTFFRENTEGEYVLGSRGVEIPDTLCMDFKVTTRPGTYRIARAAFETLEARLANPEDPPRRIFLPAPLVVRESTADRFQQGRRPVRRGNCRAEM